MLNKLFEAVLHGFLLISPGTLCLAQERAITTKTEAIDITANDKDCKKEIFIKTNSEFVVLNMVKINLLLPGTGNIIYSAGAKQDSKFMRGIALASGIWSLYNTINYASQYFDHNKSTPTKQRTQLFLLSYIVGNILNYKRINSYNRKIRSDQNVNIEYGQRDDRVYVGLIYRF